MDTIALAAAHLEARSITYKLEVLPSGFRVINVAGSDVTGLRHALSNVRIWSEDSEGHLAVSLADKWFASTGEKLEVHGQNQGLLEAAIDAVLGMI